MGRTQQLAEAWLEAAADLGIAVELLESAVVVSDFGSSAGTLCTLLSSNGGRELRSAAPARAMYRSLLGESYLSYDRDLFIDTLNDWGWFGAGEPPAWYTGEPWTT